MCTTTNRARMLLVSLLLLGITGGCSDDSAVIIPTDDTNPPDMTGYPIVSTNQTAFFDNNGEIAAPAKGAAFFGQDAHHGGTTPRYVNNGDGTITDMVTGLMWQKAMSQIEWKDAAAAAEAATTGGYDDWRLPNAKELHTILDYSRSPDATGSAAIDPIFDTTEIVNEGGQADYPFFWTSTSFEPGRDAVIICFGRALGYLGGRFLDVHGAGCQRTDLKAGEPTYGFGPHGDVRRVYNYVRLVRTP